MKKWIAWVLCALTILSLLYIFSNSIKAMATVETAKNKVKTAVESVLETATRKEVKIKEKTIIKTGHLLEYFVFSLLFSFTVLYLRGKTESGLFFSILYPCVVTALTDEHLQSMIGEERSMSVTDVLIDLSACMAGYAVAWCVFSLWQRKKKKGSATKRV